MFMVLIEDIQNLLFKCEKILEANEINFKRLKKEEKMLSKVLKDYELSDDNSIIYNEIVNRQQDVIKELVKLKTDEKSIKKVIAKIRPLLSSMDVVEDDEPENDEIGQLE